MYLGLTGNFIEKLVIGIEFLRNLLNTNIGEWGDVWSVKNNLCNIEFGFLFEEEFDFNRLER